MFEDLKEAERAARSVRRATGLEAEARHDIAAGFGLTALGQDGVHRWLGSWEEVAEFLGGKMAPTYRTMTEEQVQAMIAQQDGLKEALAAADREIARLRDAQQGALCEQILRKLWLEYEVEASLTGAHGSAWTFRLKKRGVG